MNRARQLFLAATVISACLSMTFFGTARSEPEIRLAQAAQPDRDPGDIKPKRTYARRTRYFARNELSRLCMDALRAADGTPVTTDEIAVLIRAGFPDAEVEVIDQVGDSNHFQAVVITPAFAGKRLVERHQMVYRSLQGAMADRIHALSIKAYTPEEIEAV